MIDGRGDHRRSYDAAMHVQPDGAAPPPSDLDGAAASFARVRPRLFGIAYRMLGGVADAEDVVQDVWVKWQVHDRDAVRDETAFLVTMATRLAINATQTARVRRETYVGPWLPEPVDTSADPALGAERGEALDLAVLLLLEKLTPTERAAFVLREAFDYPYERIADVLAMQVANARKLVSRARRSIRVEKEAAVDAGTHRRLLSAFLVAARAGDLDDLESLLAADVVNHTDGGGAVRNAARVVVTGRERVARLVAAFAARFWEGTDVRWVEANGSPAVLVSRAGEPVALLAATGTADGLGRLMWVMNPQKLERIARAG